MRRWFLVAFLVIGLGTSAVYLGVIEGVAEATACIVKVFSGVLSDYMGRRKALALLGYGMAALTKPLFPLASSAIRGWLAQTVGRGYSTRNFWRTGTIISRCSAANSSN